MHNNKTKWPWPGLEPGPPGPESSALPMRPPCLHHLPENIEMFSVLKEIDPTFYYLNCETIYFEFWENTQEVSISRARHRVWSANFPTILLATYQGHQVGLTIECAVFCVYNLNFDFLWIYLCSKRKIFDHSGCTYFLSCFEMFNDWQIAHWYAKLSDI